MKNFTLMLAMTAAFSTPGLSYRFVCNGLLANGEERSDECGICDDQHAARWESPQIAVAVDKTPLPDGISESDWEEAVKNSFQAWGGIDGSSLRFLRSDAKNLREFGANESMHEIFWITDKTEWRKLVGSGEFGTLGATLPRYSCGGDLGPKRVIFDADLVLNGLPHINWQMNCTDDDCISVQTTLVHELGHFFGLDHPCLLCSTSIMSARAGFNIIYPVLDDMEGIRVLYPDGSSGGFAALCGGDNDCSSGNRCIEDGRNRYCSTDCSNDGDCDVGASCEESSSSRVCMLANREGGTAKNEGENCMRSPCAEPLICAGVGEPNFYCYEPCVLNSDCDNNRQCIALSDGASVCVTVRNNGESCDHRQLCNDGLFCVFDTLHAGSCRGPCDESIYPETGCAEGEACHLFDEGVEICVPEENLDLLLDNTKDDFASGDGAGPVGSKAKPDEVDTKSGCRTTRPDDTNGMAFVALALLLALATSRSQKRGREAYAKIIRRR